MKSNFESKNTKKNKFLQKLNLSFTNKKHIGKLIINFDTNFIKILMSISDFYNVRKVLGLIKVLGSNKKTLKL